MRPFGSRRRQRGGTAIDNIYWGAVSLLVLSFFLPGQSEAYDSFRLLLTILLAALWGLLKAYRGVRDARVLEDMPTSRVRSAAQGYVELVGHARPLGSAPICPVGQEACVWWSYEVEKRGLRWKDARTVDSSTSTSRFLLEDDSGTCQIDPKDARVIPSVDATWYGSVKHPARIPDASERFLSRLFLRIPHSADGTVLLVIGLFAILFVVAGNPEALSVVAIALLVLVVGFTAGRFKYTLRLLRPGDPLYALGEFRTDGPDTRNPASWLASCPDGRSFILSTLSEEQLRRRMRRAVLPWLLWFVVGLVAFAGFLVVLVDSETGAPGTRDVPPRLNSLESNLEGGPAGGIHVAPGSGVDGEIDDGRNSNPEEPVAVRRTDSPRAFAVTGHDQRKSIANVIGSGPYSCTLDAQGSGGCGAPDELLRCMADRDCGELLELRPEGGARVLRRVRSGDFEFSAHYEAGVATVEELIVRGPRWGSGELLVVGRPRALVEERLGPPLGVDERGCSFYQSAAAQPLHWQGYARSWRLERITFCFDAGPRISEIRWNAAPAVPQ